MDFRPPPILEQAEMPQVRGGEAHPTKWLVEAMESLLEMFVHIFTNIFTDPLKCTMEILTIAVLLSLIWLTHYHWDRVCYLITGDTSVHVDHLDCLARALHFACGSGEWTRCCCGRNFVTILGQNLGILSRSVKISNIVVGDLPDVGRHNYYVCVECKTDPEMVTSVAEMKLPKVVHFPEVLIIRLRQHFLEYRLRVTVRRKRALGHDELCEVFFNPNSVIDFCEHDGPILRFEMKPLLGLECETPPWISMKFSYPNEGLESHIEEAPNNLFCTYFVPPARLVWNEQYPQGTSMSEFKTQYPLCDADGFSKYNKEPMENDIKCLYFSRAFFTCITGLAYHVGFWGFLAFSILRTYVRSCYKDYASYALAKKAIKGNHTFYNRSQPFSSEDLAKAEASCNGKVWADPKTGAPIAQKGAEYCILDFDEDVLPVCEHPPRNLRPVFLRRDVRRILKQDIGDHGLVCSASTCVYAQYPLIEHDGTVFTFILTLVGFAFLTRCFFNCCMRQVKRMCVRGDGVHHESYYGKKRPRYAQGMPMDTTRTGGDCLVSSWAFACTGAPPPEEEVYPPTSCTKSCEVM